MSEEVTLQVGIHHGDFTLRHCHEDCVQFIDRHVAITIQIKQLEANPNISLRNGEQDGQEHIIAVGQQG